MLGLPTSSCLCQLEIPKIWRRALVVGIPKPNKPLEDATCYRPISWLCISYKIFDRLIYSRIEPNIDPLLTHEQAGFRRGRSTVDQVALMTQQIEDCFLTKKASSVFVDLTAAYYSIPCHIMVLPASFCGWFLTDICYEWSWNLSRIAALLSPLVMESKADSDTLKTVSHRDLSWLLFSLMVCQWSTIYNFQQICSCCRLGACA